MKDLKFNGFTPSTIQFFKDIKDNNYKEWFDEHKHVYDKEVVLPLKALVTAMSPMMYNIDSDFELRPHRAISRIYRDVRFSKNKDPYKTCMWLSFQIPVTRDVWMDYPGYYLEINGDSYSYGMGMFMAKKKTMDAFRDEIGYNTEEFKQITQETVLDKGFEIQGEIYKRELKNDLPAYYQSWIQRKTIYVTKEKAIGDEVYSADFAQHMAEEFKSLEWLYRFMKECTLD